MKWGTPLLLLLVLLSACGCTVVEGSSSGDTDSEPKGEKPPIVQPDQSALDRRGAAEKGE